MSVMDLSLRCLAIRDTLDVPGTSHLHLEWFEMESLLLVCPIVRGEPVFREGLGGKGQMRPHLDRPCILPTLTPVAKDAPHSSAAIKGCLPTSTPWVGCQLDESLASLLTKRGESRKLLNHSTSCWSQGSHLSYRLNCNAQLLRLMFFFSESIWVQD